jgi:hypothetical protein
LREFSEHLRALAEIEAGKLRTLREGTRDYRQLCKEVAVLRKKADEFDKNNGIARNSWDKILRLQGQAAHPAITKKKKKIIELEVEAEKRNFNKPAAKLRGLGASDEIAPNAIKARNVSSDKLKQVVKDGYDAVCRTSDNDFSDMAVIHDSRRRKCTVGSEYVGLWATNTLKHKSTRLGPVAAAVKFGSKYDHQSIEQDCVLIVCEACAPDKKSPCGRLIWASDPDLIASIPADERQEYLAEVAYVHRMLMVDKYGGDIISRCRNETCHLTVTGFIDKNQLARITGRVVEADPDRRCCEACAETWCNSCGEAPYHTGRICPGPRDRHAEFYEEFERLEGRPPTVDEVRDYLRNNRQCAGVGCRIMFAKTGGCNAMTCRIVKNEVNPTTGFIDRVIIGCGTITCWRCGLARDRQDPHNHVCPPGSYEDAVDYHDQHALTAHRAAVAAAASVLPVSDVRIRNYIKRTRPAANNNNPPARRPNPLVRRNAGW